MHQIYIPDWALERALRFTGIAPKRTAMLVVDMQNFFVAEDGFLSMPAARAIVSNINRLTDAFRDAGSTIIYIRHTASLDRRYAIADWQREKSYADGTGAVMLDLLQSGQPQHALYPRISIAANDVVVDKHRYSALMPNSSDLDSILKARELDTVIVVGTATNVCCESTARDAAMLDYKVFFVSDATATQNDEVHNAALLNLCHVFADVRTTEAMLTLLPGNEGG